MTPADHSAPAVRFEPTRWSVVMRCQAGSPTRMQTQAMEELCKTYWYPLYAFLRSKGNTMHDAQDLTQGFFLSLSTGSLLSAAGPEKGRFRTLLLMGLKRFSANAATAERAWKRGGRAVFVPLDEALAEERWQANIDWPAEPEAAFDRAWAGTLMEEAVSKLREEYHSSNRGPLFDALAPRLTNTPQGAPLAEVAENLGMTEAAVKMALSRLRKVFGHSVRAAVADTLEDETQIQEELRYLLEQFQ